MEEILNNLYSIRTERGLSLRDVEKLTGVSHVQIERIELGLRSPSQKVMLKISRGLKLPVSKIFELDYTKVNI
jgi:transcriptional regulator with XRE-family HTH domain